MASPPSPFSSQIEEPLSPLTASQNSSDETQKSTEQLIPWPKTPPPTRTRKSAKALGQPLTTRSRASAASSDGSGTVPDPISTPTPTLPKRLRLAGPKRILNTTGFQGSIASSAASVPSSAVLPASIPIPPGGTQTKLSLKRQFTVPPSKPTATLRPAMASSGPGYTNEEFEQFLKFQAMVAAANKQAESPSLPVTPPQKTNQASSSSTPSSKPSASSSKAPSVSPLKRKTPDSSLKSKKESKVEGKHKAIGDEGGTPKKQKTKLGKQEDDDEKEETVLETEDYMNVELLPHSCEVWDESVQEPALVEDYKKLVNLESAVLLSWDPQTGPGNIPLSFWEKASDQWDDTTVYNIISFAQQGRYANLARIDPRKCRAAKSKMGANRHKWTLEVEKRAAICISLIGLVESCLSEAGTLHNSGKGLVSKFITGILLSYEFERTIAALGMIFRQRELYGQISQNAITFSTKPAPKDPKSSPSKSPLKRKFKGVASSATASSSTGWSSSDSLAHDAEVPVYDARGSTFDINEHIEDLDTHLPRYNGTEIPEMTLSAVGYTVSQYLDSNGKQTVSFNLQFVIVLGESNLEVESE
ncbi:hypothetical protein C8R43DRAFT_1117706 [Mycena crocata]|nr:hypothetical protein C8R43DRAFT_1117706 [Mycena crocata]